MKDQWVVRRKWILLVVLTVLIGFRDIKAKIHRNSAYLAFSRVMAADHIEATKRQADLKHFAEYISPEEDRGETLKSLSEETMLRSIFIGEYHRLRGDIDEAARWYMQAAYSEPDSLWQDSLLCARRDRLLPDGDILITDFANVDGWVLDSNNSDVVDVAFESVDGIAYISYQNRPDQRDIVAYSLYPEGGVELGYHTTLTLRVRIEPGSFLTLEAKVDDVLERYLNYYEGTGHWETVRFPLEGEILQAIKLSVSEPGMDSETADTYKVELDQMRLELNPQ